MMITILLSFRISNRCLLFLLDTDECLTSNSCHSNADCKNSEGSYTCICMAGYSGNGSVCTGKYGICLNIICILTIEQ